MKYLKNFENHDKVYDLSDLYPMSKWIENLWERIENIDDSKISNFFTEIEDTCGEDVAEIIDGMYTPDKLHYHQNGRTVVVGGIDTGDFIENFDEYKSQIEEIINRY